MDLIILDYEFKIFTNYLNLRNKLIENIKNSQLNNLTRPQLLNCVNDIKMITDPLVNITDSIEHFLKNSKNSFNDTKSLKILELQKSILLYDFLLRTTISSELELDSEYSVSDSESLV